MTIERRPRKWRPHCKATDCQRDARICGYCERHYQQVRRHGLRPGVGAVPAGKLVGLALPGEPVVETMARGVG